jgi:hypothetical protein
MNKYFNRNSKRLGELNNAEEKKLPSEHPTIFVVALNGSVARTADQM